MVRNRTGQFSISSVDSRTQRARERASKLNQKSLLLLVTGPNLKIKLTNFRATGLSMSSNDSNNRPVHLINLSIFLLGAYSLSHKIWGGQKRQFKDKLLPHFRFSVTHTSMLFLALALKKSFYFSTVLNKYYNIRIITLLNFVRFTWAA